LLSFSVHKRRADSFIGIAVRFCPEAAIRQCLASNRSNHLPERLKIAVETLLETDFIADLAGTK
jgi:hypothetical protein